MLTGGAVVHRHGPRAVAQALLAQTRRLNAVKICGVNTYGAWKLVLGIVGNSRGARFDAVLVGERIQACV